MNPDVPVDGTVEVIAMIFLCAAALLAVVRIAKGPSLPDRVIALDLLTFVGLGILAVYAMATGETVYLDIGIVLALVTFLATISFAYYIEKGMGRGGIE